MLIKLENGRVIQLSSGSVIKIEDSNMSTWGYLDQSTTSNQTLGPGVARASYGGLAEDDVLTLSDGETAQLSSLNFRYNNNVQGAGQSFNFTAYAADNTLGRWVPTGNPLAEFGIVNAPLSAIAGWTNGFEDLSGKEISGPGTFILAVEGDAGNGGNIQFGKQAVDPVASETSQDNQGLASPWSENITQVSRHSFSVEYTLVTSGDTPSANKKAFRASIQGGNVAPNLKTKGGVSMTGGSGGKHRSPGIKVK